MVSLFRQVPSDSLGRAVDSEIQRFFGGNAPIVCLQTQLVVTQSSFVEYWQPLDGVCGQSLQVYDGVGAVTLHRVQLQVSLEVASVQTGDGQPVTESSQWGSVFVPYGGSGGRGVQVAEQMFSPSEGNSTSSVTHLD